MKTRQKILLSLAAVLLGTGASLLAEDPISPPSGLLGQNRFEIRYLRHHLDGAPIDANGLAVEANWTVRPNLDLTMGYESLETDSYFGITGERRTLLVGLRVMSRVDRNRFYLEAAAGYGWSGVTTFGSDNASAYRLGVGAEFACTESILVTPFLHYTGYGGDGDSITAYGVRGTVLLGRDWHFSVTLQRDEDSTLAYGAGIGFRF